MTTLRVCLADISLMNNWQGHLKNLQINHKLMMKELRNNVPRPHPPLKVQEFSMDEAGGKH